MPFIEVKTNAAVSAETAEQLKAGLGRAITAIPGKSEAWLMVNICGGQNMYFQGSDAPCAMVEVKLYGGASSSAYQNMTERATDVVSKCLNVSPNRIYVKYDEVEHWGMGGSNF